MKRLQGLLFGFSGRIGRGQFWLGVLCILLATIALSAIAIGLGFSETVTREGYQVVNGERTEISGFRVSTTPLASLAISILLLAPWLAIGMKRRHDRGFNGYDVVAFTLLNLLDQVLSITGVQNELTFVLGVVLFVWGIVLFILLGFLRGDSGDNAYGPDPLNAQNRSTTATIEPLSD